MTVTVTLACGCRVSWDGTADPRCATHDETRVQSVAAPPPRFVAIGCRAEGPWVTRG